MKRSPACIPFILCICSQTVSFGQIAESTAPALLAPITTTNRKSVVVRTPPGPAETGVALTTGDFDRPNSDPATTTTAVMTAAQPGARAPGKLPPAKPPSRANPSRGSAPRAPARSATPQRPGQSPAPSTERNLQQNAQNNNNNNNDSLAGDVGRARSPQASGSYMMGDFLTGGALGGQVQLNCTINQPYGTQLAAPFSFHTFKIANNESPWPRNRVYVTSEYFRQVGDTTAITRETFGFERTFMQNRASFGMVLPFYTADPGTIANTLTPGSIGTFGLGTSTRGNTGDLTMIYKQALIFDPQGGNVLSVGAAVTAPTGPSTIASVTPAYTVNGVYHYGGIQPYMAFYRSIGPAFNGLFLQGFSSLDRPFSPHDSTFWFNDLGIGYYYRRDVSRGLTGVVPNFEVHVNTPLDGRTQTITATPELAALTGFPGVSGTIQYYNQVNLTSGVTFIFNRRTTLALGVVAPVATPHPFNVEFMAQFNVLRVPWMPAVPPSAL